MALPPFLFLRMIKALDGFMRFWQVFDAAKTGLWVTLLTMGLSGVVAILIFVAQNLFKSGNFTVLCRRHAFIDKRDVRLDLTFENVDSKDRVFSGFDLYGKKDGVECLLAHLDGMPLSSDPDSSFIAKHGDTFCLSIPRNARKNASMSYTISPLVDVSSFEEFSLVVYDESNHCRFATFPHFDSDEPQELLFRLKRKARK